jgi:hypothetical protein
MTMKKRLYYDRYGRVQTLRYLKRANVPTAATPDPAPTDDSAFMAPPQGQYLEVGVTLKANVTAATLNLYADHSVYTDEGVLVAACYPVVATSSLTGGAGVTYHHLRYEHMGAPVAIQLASITDGNTPDLDEPALITYRWC